ncbi:Erythritol/L-threitol-binding protein [Fundidesulfovibrio magnetotacticus]|uniref:Erythritol/L-threitol-binding protein n=1 Tax=Fundidesulfovibrio magnetotacticus TaxID=2730080 RepID=A0A6V8LWE4_9BACT|nr:sugar ABC transporter substrate-binding protein [Fundidesulfovibrio magnetotacticus]GFK94389.1 Erythritol/L-threitol-binding protein [Fundidesulfovibrio magnetotacticus]
MRSKSVFLALAALLALGMSWSDARAEVNWKQFQGTEIRVMMNKHPFTTYIEPKLAEFEQLTGIKVVMESFPEDQFRNKRTIELNSGGKLDGFMIMATQDDLYYWKAGWLLPLDDFVKDPALTDASWDQKDFFPLFMKANTIDGKLFGVVFNAETSLLSYRKDLFEQNKIKVPATMKEFEDAAKFFHGKEMDGKKMVGVTLRGKGAAATSQWSDFMFTFGGNWMEKGKSFLNSPQDIAAFKFYGDMLRNYGPEGATMLHWAESTQLFMEGKAAMIYDANVFKSLYENPKDSKVAGKVGYAVIPAGPAGSIPHLSNWSLCINKNAPAKQQKATWLFIQWATNKQNAVKALLAGVPAGRASAWDSPEYKAGDKNPDWTASVKKSYETGNPQWNPPVLNVPEIRDIVGQVIVDAIQGKDVKASADKAAELMNKKMELP